MLMTVETWDDMYRQRSLRKRNKSFTDLTRIINYRLINTRPHAYAFWFGIDRNSEDDRYVSRTITLHIQYPNAENDFGRDSTRLATR